MLKNDILILLIRHTPLSMIRLISFYCLVRSLSPTKGYKFAFTTDTKKCIHYQRLNWLKDNIADDNPPVIKSIINCSQTEIFVAHKAFGESISMLFYQWHAKRA